MWGRNRYDGLPSPLRTRIFLDRRRGSEPTWNKSPVEVLREVSTSSYTTEILGPQGYERPNSEAFVLLFLKIVK